MVAVVLLAAPLLVVPSGAPPAPPPQQRIAEAPEPAAALAAARRQGEPVGVTSLTTPTKVVAAQPDGTLTAELTAQPVRTFKNNAWVAVDPTLVEGREQSISPKAVNTELTFSGGGTDQPLVRVGAPGRSLALTWPGALPKPTLEGAKATYTAVLPGVDLVLRAEANGVVQHLVVKDAEAARALAEVELGLKTEGLTVTSTSAGTLEARDALGEVVFATPPATMWDANGRQAPVGVAVGAGVLTLTPDRTLLAEGAFPLTIDPDWRTAERGDWTKVFSGKPDSAHWHGGNDVDTWAKVGDCTAWKGCNGIATTRSYWMFDTGFLNGKQILSANFNATIVYGPSCETRDHALYWAYAEINSGTTWHNAPWGAHVQTKAAESSYTNCAGYKGIGFDVKNAVNTTGRTTYFIKAVNEADPHAWRKYDGAATKIVINYNTKPKTAYETNTEPRLAACKWCAGKPYAGSEFITLQGKLSDEDNDQLTAKWDVHGGPATDHREGPTLGSGNLFTTTVDLRNRHGQELSWTLQGGDGHLDGDKASGPAKFVVDRVGVDRQPGVTGALYQEDNRWHGGVGVPGTFTFDAAGVSDVDHYLYGWNDPPSTKADADALGGKAVVSTAPTADGPRDLYVQSVDRAGHRSPTRKFHTYVRAGNGALAQWSFEGNVQDTAFLGDRHGTAAGGTSYVPGAVGLAVELDGTTGHVTAPAVVRTDASFTVSAWAKPDRGAGTIFTQENGFSLTHQPENGGRWTFGPAQSASVAQLGTWTHLTAVSDVPAGQVRLYVDGVLSAVAPRQAPGATTGPVRIGGGFDGAIDEVKAHDRVLSDSEIRAAVSRDNVQVAYWKLDETGGTTTGNAVAGGAMGVVQGGARFIPQGAVNGAVQFGGPDDHISAGAPVVRTDQSFSVSAWVKREHELPAHSVDAALSQDGVSVNGFHLGYRQNASTGGRWEFLLPGADLADNVSGRPADEVARSSAAAELGTWTHLTGVYDASAKQVRLYVNGVLAGTAARTKGFNASGAFLIGRGKWNGVVAHRLKGAVDEVRAYSRVVSDDEIRGIVGRDQVTAGEWKLDGHTQDSSPREQHGTPVNNPDFTSGQSSMPDAADLALRLDGAPRWVSAPHVVDVDRSFSVAVWARPDQTGGSAVVLSQDGAKGSGFKLRARPDGRWGFAMFSADDSTSTSEATGGTVQSGQWVHLAGVYDAAAKQLQLHVNGVLAGSATHTQTWSSGGGLQFGRAKAAGNPAEFFKGSLDDVTAYARTLFASEIQTMAGRDLTLVHNYRLDEGSGRNAADAVGSRVGTLTGDAAFAPGRVGNGAAFDGAGDAITTTGVDLRTDQAFTVSALVRLPGKDCDLATRTECRVDAVSLDGTKTSKFRLGHVVDSDNNQLGAWTFEMPESDADQAVVTKAAVSTLPTEVGAWVHLVGVYDPATKKLWLHVNGTRVGDGSLNTPWHPAGGLAIGRAKVASVPAAFWPGTVDDIRLYTGQLDKERIATLFRAYPAEASAPALPVADAGHWKLDENGADSSSRGNALTFSGGTGWIGGRSGPSAWLDGKTGHAHTSGPVLDTGRGFSAAAWVHLTSADSSYKAVIAQDANRLSAFALQFDGTSKKWSLIAPTVDKDDPGHTVVILNSAEPAAVGQWTHLAFSHDTQTKQLRLYVNGMLAGAAVGVTVLPSAGPLTIGRSKWNGQNTAFFPRGIDDVRAYSRPITDGEVRKVHDDVADADFAHFRFDDSTTKDRTWRGNHATTGGGTGFDTGADGKGLRLNGTDGAATVPAGLPMRDSFTVSAWAKLDRDDQVATIVSQDGDRASGFALRYRPGPRRWTFGGTESDADGTQAVEVTALATPKTGEWTHVTGVYDHAGRQLRVYVNGELSGTRDNVVLWRATGKLVLGRDKTGGTPSGFFAGVLDDVRIGEGIAADAVIAGRGAFAAPQKGQLGRFVNASGDSYTGRTGAVRGGYRFQEALGLAAAAGPNTRMTYACANGADSFTSIDPGCDGAAKIGEIGLVYTVQPLNIPTTPVHRCKSATDRFDAMSCGAATNEGLIGYFVAYGNLARYYYDGVDHVSTTGEAPASYRADANQGLLALTAGTDTQQLVSCQDGADRFVSVDATCEGKAALGPLGHLWTAAPEGMDSLALYRCRTGTDSFTSIDATCEGATVDRRLGHVLTSRPAVTAAFEVFES